MYNFEHIFPYRKKSDRCTKIALPSKNVYNTFKKIIASLIARVALLLRLSSWTQDVNWTLMKRSEDVLYVFWTSYVRSIYVLYPGGGSLCCIFEFHSITLMKTVYF